MAITFFDCNAILFLNAFLWKDYKTLSWANYLEAVIVAPIFLDICI